MNTRTGSGIGGATADDRIARLMPSAVRALVCTGALVLLAAAPATAATPYGAGSAGLGDPFFPNAGNGGYDARHYSLDLTYEPATSQLVGETEVRAMASQDLGQFDLDLRGFAVSAVTVNGKPAAFTRDGQELVITARPKLKAGADFTVVVDYAGTPGVVVNADGAITGWIPTDDGAFVTGEPVGSPGWYPVNDNPRDKATYDVRITVPDGLTALSNGVLVRSSTHAGKTTWVWRESAPMASYLVTATVGRFDLTQSSLPDGTPSYIAVDPRLADRTVLARIPEIVSFFSATFGPYPFDAVGAIVDDAPSGLHALETQSKPVYPTMPDETVVAHELAHQWFGDSVTPTVWSDIWLNEGFASFAEFLWGEHVGGPTLEELFQEFMAIPDAAPAWTTPPGNPGSPLFMFDGFAVYFRGAATLEALREKVGDVVFYGILRDWAAEHRWGNATTQDFIALAESDSGLDLGHFFDVWLFQPTKPTSW